MRVVGRASDCAPKACFQPQPFHPPPHPSPARGEGARPRGGRAERASCREQTTKTAPPPIRARFDPAAFRFGSGAVPDRDTAAPPFAEATLKDKSAGNPPPLRGRAGRGVKRSPSRVPPEVGGCACCRARIGLRTEGVLPAPAVSPPSPPLPRKGDGARRAGGRNARAVENRPRRPLLHRFGRGLIRRRSASAAALCQIGTRPGRPRSP